MVRHSRPLTLVWNSRLSFLEGKMWTTKGRGRDYVSIMNCTEFPWNIGTAENRQLITSLWESAYIPVSDDRVTPVNCTQEYRGCCKSLKISMTCRDWAFVPLFCPSKESPGLAQTRSSSEALSYYRMWSAQAIQTFLPAEGKSSISRDSTNRNFLRSLLKSSIWQSSLLVTGLNGFFQDWKSV